MSSIGAAARRAAAHSNAIPICLLLLALAVRLPGLGTWPPPIHQDEASNGVDAWSLVTTGMDRAGRAWPVFLEGFGARDNRTSLYAVIDVPFVALLGPGPFSTRMPASLAGAWTVLATFLLVRRCRGGSAAGWAGLLLALNPWHIYLSRFGHEASLTPAFLVTGLWLWSRGATCSLRQARDAWEVRRGWIETAAAGVVFAAGLYTYPSYRIFLPFMIAGIALVGWERSPRRWAVVVCSIGIATLPLGIASLQHPERLFARSSDASLFHQVRPWSLAIQIFLTQYARHYMPGFLALHGDGNPLHAPAGGQLLAIEFPFLVLGVVLALRRRDSWDRLCIIWLLTYPLASAASLGDEPAYVPHSLRAAVGLPVFQILGGAALAALRPVRRGSALAPVAATPGRHRLARDVAAVAAVGLLVVCFAAFAVRFTGSHARRTAHLYHRADARAFAFVRSSDLRYEGVIVSARENHQAYVQAMLYGLIHPRSYQTLPRKVTQTETFHLVRQVGNFYFVHDRADLEAARASLHGRVLVLAGPGDLSVGEVLAEFPDPSGDERSGRVLRLLTLSPR